MFTGRYSPEEERKAIWVYLEQTQGSFEGVSLELLAKGRQMADESGWPLVGLLPGYQVADLVQTAVAHGADQVILAEHPLLREFSVEGYTQAAFQAILDAKPSVLLLGATPNGRDLAGRLAVRLRTGLNADCTGLDLVSERGVLVSQVSGFGGGVLALIEMQQHRPQMATVRPGVFIPTDPDWGRTGRLLEIEVDLAPEMIRTRIVERVIGQAVDLTQVPILAWMGTSPCCDNWPVCWVVT
jgi:electron transfer flavoprotein alpha subunit